MQINFQGKLISTTRINELINDSTRYQPKEVSFVKLSPHSNNDIHTIKEINNLWEENYTSLIQDDIMNPQNKSQFYILTTQRDNFQKTDAKKVLGIVQCDNNCGLLEIETLQTHPQYKYNKLNPLPKYKGIGRSILDCCKQLKNVSTIYLSSVENAKNFYLKNKFHVQNPKNPLVLFWNKN